MTLDQAEAFVQAVASSHRPVAARLRASDLGQRRIAADSAQLASSRSAAFRSSTTMSRLRSRWPGQQGAGGSGNMPAASIRVAALAATTKSSKVSVAAIATCSMETRLRFTGFGMPPTSGMG